MCEVREFPFPTGLIPIPREWPIPGNMTISAEKTSFPFPLYSRGIWLIPGEILIPGKFPFFKILKKLNKENNKFCYKSVKMSKKSQKSRKVLWIIIIYD